MQPTAQPMATVSPINAPAQPNFYRRHQVGFNRVEGAGLVTAGILLYKYGVKPLWKKLFGKA